MPPTSVEMVGGADIGAPHDGQSFHHCHTCGWQYPNHRPSARKRRAHKKHCGKIEALQSTKGNVDKVADVSSSYDSPDGILERNAEELVNIEGSNASEEVEVENRHASLSSETPDQQDGEDNGKKDAMRSEQEESTASSVQNGQCSEEGSSFRNLRCEVIPNGCEVFKRTEPLSPGSVLDSPEINIPKEQINDGKVQSSSSASIDAISGHPDETSAVIREEVQVISSQLSKEIYASDDGQVSAHEASSANGFPGIRTISPDIQTANEEHSNSQVLKEEIHTSSKSNLEAIIEMEMQQRNPMPNTQQLKESYAIDMNGFGSSPPNPALKLGIKDVSPGIMVENMECFRHPESKNNGEISEVPISHGGRKVHTSLKNLLEEGIEIETEEEILLSNTRQVLQCDDPRSRGTFFDLIYDESREAAARRVVQKEWNSPARFPQRRKDIRGRPKGKARWVPFFCCPSGKSVSVV